METFDRGEGLLTSSAGVPEGIKAQAEKLGPLPADPTPKPFRVLLVYPNYMFVNLLPTNVGILTACLRQHGFQVALFDTTFYKTAERSIDDLRVEYLQVRKFSLADFGVTAKPNHFLDDFEAQVRSFRPHLIGYTVVEDTWPQALTLMERVKDLKIPTIVGGVFATLAPEVVFQHPLVDIMCVGEGEYALVELCEKMHRGEDISGVRNLWVKTPRGPVRNPIRPPIPLEYVPHGDFDLFEVERFYRPMQGKIFRMVPIETDRGCPYKCRFCEAPSLVNKYRAETDAYYFRRKPWDRVREEIDLYIAKYSAEYVYFNAETFLAMNDREFDEFIAMYRKIRLPFWCQTRIETITERRVRLLEEVNCNRISIGLEHGNEEFRKKTIGKGFSNKELTDVFDILNTSSIPITVNNIVGFPDETRDLIFDTIELNRELQADSLNAYIYTPYRGTPIRDEALRKGYITEDIRTGTLIGSSTLNMPQLPRQEIEGLVRTFSLYVKFPVEEWPAIRRAETMDEEGNRAFAELSRRYYERFFDRDFKSSRKACFSTRIYGAHKQETEVVPT